MLKRAGRLGRVVVVAMVGVVVGFGGAIGESVAQNDMKKDDMKKMDDTMKPGSMKSTDTMKPGDTKKSSDTMMKGEKKDMKTDGMKKDETMEKKP